ncbi:MAG TPA: hypothetical protein VFO33_03865 [Casimicrobiaceae bacterium]|nr:hypothetical protein [Casimicrobiaceae bacterium]
MKRARNEPARPYGGREYEWIRAGPEGSYWRADGVEVRVAAPEREREREIARQHLRSGVAIVVRSLFGAVFAR